MDCQISSCPINKPREKNGFTDGTDKMGVQIRPLTHCMPSPTLRLVLRLYLAVFMRADDQAKSQRPEGSGDCRRLLL